MRKKVQLKYNFIENKKNQKLKEGGIGATKRGSRGCPGTPNKEQNGANTKLGEKPHRGIVFHKIPLVSPKF